MREVPLEWQASLRHPVRSGAELKSGRKVNNVLHRADVVRDAVD